MSKSVIALVRLKAAHGDLARVRTELANLVEETVKEPGCAFFHIQEVGQSVGEFILLEKFVDREALESHLAAPYTQHYFAGNHTTVLGMEPLADLR